MSYSIAHDLELHLEPTPTLSRVGPHFFSNARTFDHTVFSDKLQFLSHSRWPEHGHADLDYANLCLRIFIMLSLRLSQLSYHFVIQ